MISLSYPIRKFLFVLAVYFELDEFDFRLIAKTPERPFMQHSRDGEDRVSDASINEGSSSYCPGVLFVPVHFLGWLFPALNRFIVISIPDSG